MPKMLVVYYSRTRHTEKMAISISEGVKSIKDIKVVVKRAEETTNK